MLTDYEQRMVDEYWQTKERYDKLRRMIVKYEAGTLDFKPKCTVGLLRDQLDTMLWRLRCLSAAPTAHLTGIQCAVGVLAFDHHI